MDIVTFEEAQQWVEKTSRVILRNIGRGDAEDYPLERPNSIYHIY